MAFKYNMTIRKYILSKRGKTASDFNVNFRQLYAFTLVLCSKIELNIFRGICNILDNSLV